MASFSTSSLSVGAHCDYGELFGRCEFRRECFECSDRDGEWNGAGCGGFSVSVAGTATVGVGSVASLQLAVAPQTGNMQAVQLSCGDLPSESACTFSAHTIPAEVGRRRCS